VLDSTIAATPRNRPRRTATPSRGGDLKAQIRARLSR